MMRVAWLARGPPRARSCWLPSRPAVAADWAARGPHLSAAPTSRSCCGRAVAPAELGPLPLVVALGAAEGLDRLGIAADLKWPNDLLVGGRKLAGVLLEMGAEADRVDWVVVGIGVNVHRPDGVSPALECRLRVRARGHRGDARGVAGRAGPRARCGRRGARRHRRSLRRVALRRLRRAPASGSPRVTSSRVVT